VEKPRAARLPFADDGRISIPERMPCPHSGKKISIGLTFNALTGGRFKAGIGRSPAAEP